MSSILHDQGVTNEVRAMFNLKESTPLREFSPENSLGTTKIDKIIGTVQSQDWCADIFDKYKGSVAEIKAASNGKISSGTGFIISENGYILTNDHVVYDEDSCSYCKKLSMTLEGTKKAVPLNIINSDKKNDVALCAFDKEKVDNCRAVPCIKDYSSLKQGARIVLIGNPLSMGIAPVEGIVRYTHNNEGNLVYTALSNHGDSGGPVFNMAGECVGINKSIVVSVTRGDSTVEVQGITNATPMDKIDELLDRWCKDNHIKL